MVAAGWSDPEVAERVLTFLKAWFDVLTDVAGEAEARFGSLGPFSAADLAGLVGLAFLGGETLILLGDEQWSSRVRACLRSPTAFLREAEEAR